jgi:hypothetical protein
MANTRGSKWLVGVLSLSLLSGAALAADAANVDELRAQLEAQQVQIDALQQQLTSAAAQDMNQARTQDLKQQIREVLSEREFRESLMTSTLQAGYDNGFFIRSTDDKFKIQFNALMQMRFTHYSSRPDNRYLLPGFRRHDRTGFDAQRIEFAISGHAYTKDLTYSIELEMDAGSGYNTQLSYAWANYRIMDEFQIRAGLMRIANMRSNVASVGTYQLVDQPLADAVFGLGDGAGIRFWGELMEGKGAYYLDIVNSLGSSRTRTITNDEVLYTQGHDNNPAVAFRTVWAIMGGTCLNPDDEPEFTTPCDMAVHTEPALNLGFHYAFNEDWHDGTLAIPFARQSFFRPGGFGLTSSDGLQIHQAGADLGFKYQGFSATAEYVMRLIDVRSAAHAPYTPLFLLTGDGSTMISHGGYLQCGYFLPIPGRERKFEVVGRVGGIYAGHGGVEGTWEYAGGLNYYIDGHNVKLQTDVTKITELPVSSSDHSYANVNDDALIWRVQLQVAF